MPTKILFVCLGNICRSPMAESIFRHQAKQGGLQDVVEVDSAGTGDWHVGQLPDPRTIRVLRENGIVDVSKARQVRPQDFQDYDLIVAMDASNVNNLERWAGSDPGRVKLMRTFDPVATSLEVPDPYYGDMENFRDVYAMLDRACAGLLQSVRERS